MKRKNGLICVLLSLTAVFFLCSPVYSLFVQGIFRWHVTQPALWRDAVELLMCFVIIWILSAVAWSRKGIIILIAGSVYLLSTGTLAQCAVSYLYIEIIIYIGRSFIRLIQEEAQYSAGVSFLTGCMVWGGAAITMSLLQVGTIEALRALTVTLFLLAIINPKNQAAMDDILVVRYVKYLNENKKGEFCINLFFVLVMMISLSRVNTHIDFDSYWYALYTDKCLFGEHSFYDYLGYTDFVYYYPKFKELLMAPITGLGLPGYLISSNLWIMAICAIEVYQYLLAEIEGSRDQILGIVYLIFSSVCIVGISGTAKSDAVSYLFILILILYFMRYLRSKERNMLWIAVSSGIMSYTVKYTSFLFSSVIFLLIVAAVLFWTISGKIQWEKPGLLSVVLMALAFFIFVGIIYRTYRLTGYPTYREGSELWNVLGVQAKPFFDAPITGRPEDVFAPDRIYSVLFQVDNAEKIRAQWTGNYGLFWMLCLLLLYRKREENQNKFLMAVTLALVIVSLCFLITMAEPDGNYFSIAVVLSACYLLIRMTESAYWAAYKKWFTTVLALFMLLNIVFVFVTHPSWVTGTRFSDNPAGVLYMSEETKYKNKDEMIKELGMYEINERLKDIGGMDFILVDSADTKLCMLDARVQLAAYLFHGYASGAGIHDYEMFRQYVDYAGVKGFVIAKDGSGEEQFDSYVAQYVVERASVERIDTERYCYYRIRQ